MFMSRYRHVRSVGGKINLLVGQKQMTAYDLLDITLVTRKVNKADINISFGMGNTIFFMHSCFMKI